MLQQGCSYEKELSGICRDALLWPVASIVNLDEQLLPPQVPL